MKNLLKGIWEHIITRKKYNKKCIEVEMLKEDIERLRIEKRQQKNTFELQKEVLEDEIKELQNKIIELKKKGK